MKHHIAVKFTAFLLAILSLFTLIASAGGIIGLTAFNLYEQSVDQLYNESMHNTRQNLAMHLVHQYASLNLGKLPDSYFYDQWGSSWMHDNFQYGSYYYTICDENGIEVASTAQDVPGEAMAYTHVVTDMSFRHLIEVFSDDESLQPHETEFTIPSATAATEMPGETDAPDVSEGTEATADPSVTEPEPSGETDDTAVPTEEIPQEETIPPAVATGTILIVQDTDILHDSFFDPENGHWVEFSYFIDKLPPYTVTLYLMPGAVVVEPIWNLLTVIWHFRYALFYVLGGSILLFAICAVYLCCAAGRKPGRQEVRAEGLNRIPLDLYGVMGVVGIWFILFFGMEVAGYLLRRSPDVLVPFLIVAGCGICLIFVGFCFACAAQFKTPGGFWWRNTLIGHSLRAVKHLGKKSIAFCRRSFPWCKDTLIRFFRFLIKVLKYLWQKSILLILALYRLAEKVLTWFFQRMGRFFRWLWRKLSRFFEILPLTWQWLLTGFGMFLMMALVFASNGEELLTVICLGICIGIILYGAHCFGILLESTKRMSKGDLDTKVSDQFLLGSFKEFAGDLNNLADVAVIAAQKQLKSERMKTELITNVSHDIKTPLTSIINYVDLLEKPHTEQEGAEYLEVLHRQSQRLKKLVDDLMEMSKASTGNMAVDITSVDAAEAINQALGEFADKLERANLTPLFRQPEEPIYMKADGRLVWRVMSNLLSNAVKYALPGTRVYIDLAEAEGKVIISMKNISREELNVSADELVERFVRGDTSRNTEGSGLGLNIAQSLMELQKGQLQLLVDGDLFKVTLVFPAVQL